MTAAPDWRARLDATGERMLQGALTGTLAALGFFLPWSTAGTSIALVVLLILCVPFASRLVKLRLSREPVIVAGLALLVWIAMRTLAEGPGPRTFSSINRYHELFMAAFLWGLLCVARRPQALFAGLMASAVCFAIAHWLAPFEPRLAVWLSHRRISAGFGLAVCAFLLYEHARLGLVRWRLALPGVALFAGTVLFASDGRTGHIVLVLLLTCAAWRTAPPGRWRWRTAVVFGVAFALLSALSGPMRSRLTETLSAAHAVTQDAELTSTSIRVQLLRTGVIVAQEHLLVGTGWSSYQSEFARATGKLGVPAGPWSYGDNPHNEFLMQLGAGGLPALLLFLAWLALPVVDAQRRGGASPWPGALACITVAFAVGCMFNSLLLDFVEGHLYGAVLAWLLAKRTADSASP